MVESYNPTAGNIDRLGDVGQGVDEAGDVS